jgi:broad specificity phosphatase PhoE
LKLDDVLFFFIRHGETPDNIKKAYRSWSNAPEAQLSPAGRKAADEAGRYLKAVGANIQLVVSDSLDRVQETVERIAKSYPGAQLQFVRALHPLNMGDYTGKSKKEHPVEPFLKDKKKRIPGGETVEEFDQRQTGIFTKIFELTKDLPRASVLVGGHGSNVAYLYDEVFHPGEDSPGYEGLVEPGGLIAATPRGLVPLTRVRGIKSKEKGVTIEGNRSPLPVYPPDHLLGMKVPKGGSDCEKCGYLAENKLDCTQKEFQEWNKSKVIPDKIDEYCCDFFEVEKA